MFRKIICISFFWIFSLGFGQEIALLKYSGGGDWYANPTSLPNLIKYSNQNINTKIKVKPATVEPSSPDLFSYPYVHMTGHGNVVFSDSDVINLRNYLTSGGFLHIDDNYGMDQYIRKEIKKYFQTMNLLKFPQRIRSFKNQILFRQVYQKFMNMMVNGHKLMEFLLIRDLSFYILTKLI